MFGLIKTIFNKPQEVSISDDPFGRNPKPVEFPGSTSSVAEAPVAPRTRVHRDEIIGASARLMGYRFRPYRAGSAVMPTPEEAQAALLAEKVALFAQRRMALIPVAPDAWESADHAALAAAHTVFLLEAGDAESPPEVWRTVMGAIHACGAKVALTMAGMSRDPSLLASADLLLIDFNAFPLKNLERFVRSLREKHPALQLIIDGVGSWTEHRFCQGLGAAFSLGGFAASPDEELSAEKLNQSVVVMIELLNLLRRDADHAELVAVAKRDPGVAVKILDMANSPISGLSAPVASVQQALVVLGRDVLYRWLSLAIYRANNSPRNETLLEIALHRARFLEVIGQRIRSRQESEELFLVGMLSLLDSLLCVPMAQAIEKMTLPQVVRDVLLASEGPYGRFLMLALAHEKGRHEQIETHAQILGLTGEDLEIARQEAQAWTEEALQAT